MRAHTAGQLREQAHWCAEMGSPLYGWLLQRAADDVEAGGPVWAVLEPHASPGRGDALALRLMAAVHRLVLSADARALAPHYPSAGGKDEDREACWAAFQHTCEERAARLRELVGQPCQTNEVGRCAALVFGFLEAVQATRLPLRLLEVGASAGLNLRWDHFHYGDGSRRWGDPASPVDLDGLWDHAPAHLPSVQVVERLGCDRRPLDPLREDHRLTLESSVWADQTRRLDRLRGAISIARRVPATLEAASLTEWLPARLDPPAADMLTVVFHSVVEEYLAESERAAFHGLLERHGAHRSPSSPLAWVRLEPLAGQRRHQLRLRLWPSGEERLLALCGAHGQEVRAFAPRPPRPPVVS